jgi:hypothetical protein
LDLQDASFEFQDDYKGVRIGRQRLFPIATVVAGKKTPGRV